MGYILVDSFNPEAEDTQIFEELRETFAAFEEAGVERIVVDIMNNGGGRVSLVLKLVQMFTKRHIENFDIQIGTRPWMDQLVAMREADPNVAVGEIYRRLEEQTLKERNQGKLLTDPLPIETLMPYDLDPQGHLKKNPKVVLLQNELVASAGDMAAVLFRSSGTAVTAGARSMGAGGNVETYFGPFWQVSLTAGLLVHPRIPARPGQTNRYYLENNGSDVHHAFDTSLSAPERYKGAKEIGFDMALHPEKYPKPDRPYRRTAKQRERREAWYEPTSCEKLVRVTRERS